MNHCNFCGTRDNTQVCRWEAVTFSPFSVLLPLCNILKCSPSISPIVLRTKFIDHVIELQRRFKEFPHSVDTMELCVFACSFMSRLEGEACMSKLRSQGIIGKLRDLGIEVATGRFVDTLDAEERSVPRSQITALSEAAMLLADQLAEAPMTFCMALSPGCVGSTGPSFPSCSVRMLDKDTVDLICQYAFFSPEGC